MSVASMTEVTVCLCLACLWVTKQLVRCAVTLAQAGQSLTVSSIRLVKLMTPDPGHSEPAVLLHSHKQE